MEHENQDQQSGAESQANPLSKAREWLIKANPDVVPELVTGDTIEALEASIEPARAAYKRIADALTPAAATSAAATSNQTPATPTAPVVPAGAATNPVDPSKLSPSELISRGVAARRAQSR